MNFLIYTRVKKLGIPALLYLFFFCLFTWPSLCFFRTHVLTDEGDGLQNLWNLWWVNKSLSQLHQSPWYTRYLHYPYGTSLVGHTLTPFNGLLAMPLLRWLPLFQTYNVLLIGSFVATGVFAFLLSSDWGGNYAGSLLAGFITTFCNYHMAHAQGHLQLIAFEGVPLFLFCWSRLLRSPSVGHAVAVAGSLGIVLLCDYYYFLYAVLTAIFLCVFKHEWYRPQSGWRPYLIPAGIFFGLCAVLFAPLLMSLFALSRTGVEGSHAAAFNSTDLLAPFVPGAFWRFAALTQSYWSRWSGDVHETSVYIGWSVIALAIYAWKSRALVAIRHSKALAFALFFFFVMSCGPHLHVGGHDYSKVILPYAWMEAVFPSLRISGCPVRMMSMVLLLTGLFAGAGFQRAWQGSRRARALANLCVGILVVEYWPQPLPVTRLVVPRYVETLRNAPDGGGVIDTVSSPTWALYFQTVHQKPIGLGYISRVPESVVQKDRQVIALYRQGAVQQLARDYGFRYLVIRPTREKEKWLQPYRRLLEDPQGDVFDLSS